MSKTNLRIYRQLAWVGVMLIAGAIVVALLQAKFIGALTLVGFLIAAIGFILLDDQLPNLFDLLFVLAALLNAGGWVWDLFHLPGPYDEITHAYTTFALTLALSFLVYGALLTSFYDHRLVFVLAIASFGISIGAIWEVTEWLIGVIDNLQDTLMDLVMDSIGALLAALFSLVALQERVQGNRRSFGRSAWSHHR